MTTIYSSILLRHWTDCQGAPIELLPSHLAFFDMIISSQWVDLRILVMIDARGVEG